MEGRRRSSEDREIPLLGPSSSSSSGSAFRVQTLGNIIISVVGTGLLLSKPSPGSPALLASPLLTSPLTILHAPPDSMQGKIGLSRRTIIRNSYNL